MSRINLSINPTGRAIVRPMTTCRILLAGAYLSLAACEIGDINVTTGEEKPGSEETTTDESSTSMTMVNASTSEDATGSTGTTGSDTSGGTESSGTTGSLSCAAPVAEGKGGIYMPDNEHTVSGCFDAVADFVCSTCDDWCVAGGFGMCVGVAPLEECGTVEVGLGYDIGCDVAPDASVAWRCVCIFD